MLLPGLRRNGRIASEMKTARTVLVVEDEADMARLLKYNLSQKGYRVLAAGDGERALALAGAQRPDLILLDLALPGIGGLNVLRELKSKAGTQDIPIIIVSALGSEDDVVLGLDLGADDYVTKPFGMRALLARVAAALRRREVAEEAEETLTCGEVEVNFARHEVTVAGRPAALTPSEFDLFTYLARRPGRVFTRRHLCDHALGAGESIQERSIDAHIRTIRRKLGREGRRIQTVWGIGYKFAED